MKWEQRLPRPGDMLRVGVDVLYHYGICTGDDEVIQFGRNPANRRDTPHAAITVCATDLRDFAQGGQVEVAVAEEEIFRPAEAIVAAARSELGKGGYHILYNNCEHFAYRCATGTAYCAQTEDIRMKFRSLSVVDLYIAPIPDTPVGRVAWAPRQAQIDGTANEKLRRERYFVWKLLEYAVNRSFGLKAEGLTFSVDENGKWSCGECFFSLSHSRGAVAVAVSRKRVGVDIESTDRPMSAGLPGKILTDTERQEYDALTEGEKLSYLLQAWCAKEALFKAGDDKQFRPTALDTAQNVRTGTVTVAQHPYCYAVATDTPEKLRIYENIRL